jgi:hypothetical protein
VEEGRQAKEKVNISKHRRIKRINESGKERKNEKRGSRRIRTKKRRKE